MREENFHATCWIDWNETEIAAGSAVDEHHRLPTKLAFLVVAAPFYAG
ncbi:MAG: hypothetical protein ACRES7_01095 [Gammaproteobacteria bacterium]